MLVRGVVVGDQMQRLALGRFALDGLPVRFVQIRPLSLDFEFLAQCRRCFSLVKVRGPDTLGSV